MNSTIDDIGRETAVGVELDPAVFPELYNLSARFHYRFLPRPRVPAPPDFLYVPYDRRRAGKSDGYTARFVGAIAMWNSAWESAQLRQHLGLLEWFDEDASDGERAIDLVPGVRHLTDQNIYLLPDTEKRFLAYAPLYALLPLHVLRRFGLPPLRRQLWPSMGPVNRVEEGLPGDFLRRFKAALAAHLWPMIETGSPLGAFSADDPVKLLAHSPEFWVPHATAVIEDRLRALPFVEFEEEGEQRELAYIQRDVPPDEGSVDRCRVGGHVWCGEEDAREAAAEMIEVADRNGRLRALLDAVRSNRVEDDFSSRWSYAREDFERKLYSKRSRVRVRFVELDQAVGVAGPQSELSENLLWQDFFSLLDTKERQIVVCLARGETRIGNIARRMGYANHSPVSKALAGIRRKAEEYLLWLPSEGKRSDDA